MVKAIQVHQPGGVEELKYEDVSLLRQAQERCKSAIGQLALISSIFIVARAFTLQAIRLFPDMRALAK